MCILCTPRPIYRSTYRSCVGRHIDRCSTDMSVDMSTDTRPIYRSRCVGRHINRHINRDIGHISTDTRPICRSICQPRVVVRQSADMSIDRLPTFRRYLTNRTDWSPIWSVIIRVINKIGRPRSMSPIC